jgi:putative transposase
MPKCLRRFHSTGQRHFTPGLSPELPKACSCYRRQPFLASARRRDYFLKVFEEVREKYDLVVWGCVVMPEHFHILISEPAKGNVARVMQVLKQRVSRAYRKKKKLADQMKLWESPPVRAFWQPRSHDFNVFTERKHVEKPSSVNKRYVHRNPVKRGLVTSPELCRWSSFRDYRLGEEGPVKIGAPSIPPFAAQRVGHP